jgi:hypothetical protein
VTLRGEVASSFTLLRKPRLGLENFGAELPADVAERRDICIEGRAGELGCGQEEEGCWVGEEVGDDLVAEFAGEGEECWS